MFGKKQKEDKSTTGLQQKTMNILNLFRETVNNLKSVNESAKEEISVQESIIANATQEKDRYQELIAGNDKIINNINQNFL